MRASIPILHLTGPYQGTISASQFQSLRPWQPEPLNVDMGGSIHLVGKATAIAPMRADFAQAPPALPEKEAVVSSFFMV